MSGFDNQVMFASNVDFSGSTNVQGKVTTNGQLLIGSTASPNIQVGNLVSPDGSVTIGYSSPNITLKATGGGGGVTSVSGTANRITSTGGATPIIDIDATYVGQTSITTLGTIATGTWSATNIALNKGGTNASLTASNGGIFYSTATAGAILSGTATANQILMSGSSTAPSWSTSTYPSTNSTGDLIYGSASNTLSTLAIATIPGQFLNYDGTNVNWFNPRQESMISDDWISQNTQSQLQWRATTSGTGAAFSPNVDVDSGHPGTVQLSSGTTTTGTCFMSLGPNSSSQGVILGGALISLIWVLKIDTLSNGTDTFQVVAGIGANQGSGSVANGIYFSYSDAGAAPNWQINTAKASATSTADSGVAASTNFVTLQMIINAAGSNVSFYINGTQTSNSPIATNIPVVAISPMAWILKSAGTTARTINIDYFWMYQKLTSTR